MPSTKSFLDYIMDQLSDVDNISFRSMMGEYIIYYKEKVIGGIYDDRFLVKPVPTALKMMPDAEKTLPYNGANEMLTVEFIEDRIFLGRLIRAMYEELPSPKKNKHRL